MPEGAEEFCGDAALYVVEPGWLAAVAPVCANAPPQARERAATRTVVRKLWFMCNLLEGYPVLDRGRQCRFHPGNSAEGSAFLERPRDRLHLVALGELRAVAVGGHQAQEAERLVGRGAELVPRHRRHVDQIVRVDGVGLVADEALAMAADHHDGVHVVVPLERRVAAGRDLEVAQLRRRI